MQSKTVSKVVNIAASKKMNSFADDDLIEEDIVNKKEEIKIDQLIDLQHIMNNPRKVNLLEMLLSNYSYYKIYIPLEYIHLFIDFVDCYLLGKEEYIWKCEYIANQLAGMDFYNNTKLDGGIIRLLYSLADQFK